MSRQRYDAIFFDMGHTLAWFNPKVEEIARQALSDAGADFAVEEVRAAIRSVYRVEDQDGATRRFPATPEYDAEMEERRNRELLRILGVEGDEIYHKYIARATEIYRAPGTLRLYDDVLPALDRLRDAGYRLGIISNWSWNLRERVRQVGLQDYFEVVMASAYAGCQKPNPDIFHQALAQMGTTAERSVHVGDFYEADVLGARAAGMEPILLDRKGKTESPDCAFASDMWGVLAHLGEA